MNSEVRLTLDDAVAEVLGQLTGLDLTYEAELDRYRAITRQLNRALRANALEHEWSYYASTTQVGTAGCGSSTVIMSPQVRPRIINDDAVQLRDKEDRTVQWAYFLPRDALHKYAFSNGLWAAVTRNMLTFSRAFTDAEDGLSVHVPVMREPIMFRLPATGEEVPDHIREQPIDFSYPDLITSRASYYYAMSDPVMQPRAQTLEAEYKDLMYQMIERDDRHTDSPYTNEFVLPLENGIVRNDAPPWPHPRSTRPYTGRG